MRDFIFTHSKQLAIFIIGAIIFQSCKVYEKQPTTLEQAISVERRNVKVITVDDRELYFDSLYYKNNKLYGLITRNKNFKNKTEIYLQIESIKSIHLLNLKKSRLMTTLFILGIPVALFGILILVTLYEIETNGIWW
jgi:hypothetical protein